MPYDPSRAAAAAVEAAAAAAQVLQDRFRSGKQPLETWMKSPGALVTDADIGADKAISEVLLNSGLSIGIRSEESTSGSVEPDTCWLVDPLCGTVSFSAGMVHWGVNIALLVDGQLRLGLVSIPAANEQLIAVKGNGVHLNGVPWKGAAPAGELAQATVGVEADGGHEWDRVLTAGIPWVSQVGQINTFASAAYPAAQLCLGRLSAAVFYKIAPVHIAAGACIAMELGLPATDAQGQSLDWTVEGDLPVVVMGWPEVHGRIIEAMGASGAS